METFLECEKICRETPSGHVFMESLAEIDPRKVAEVVRRTRDKKQRLCTHFTGRQCSCKPCTSYDRDVRLSVCLSVCPSVTRWHCVKTTQARITKSSPTDSPMTLVFGIKHSSRNSKGFTPSEIVK